MSNGKRKSTQLIIFFIEVNNSSFWIYFVISGILYFIDIIWDGIFMNMGISFEAINVFLFLSGILKFFTTLHTRIVSTLVQQIRRYTQRIFHNVPVFFQKILKEAWLHWYVSIISIFMVLLIYLISSHMRQVQKLIVDEFGVSFFSFLIIFFISMMSLLTIFFEDVSHDSE